MLFNEPKLLKSRRVRRDRATRRRRFSALQRAEIAEIKRRCCVVTLLLRFSALQRAEIAEMQLLKRALEVAVECFSALQRAEIAEIQIGFSHPPP